MIITKDWIVLSVSIRYYHTMSKENQITGVGVGLRQPHYQQFLKNDKLVSWLEVLTDNYIYSHGRVWQTLLNIRKHYPMVMHGVGLNIGSTDALSFDYLVVMRDLAEAIEPAWVSDHLCWTGVDGIYSHDLLPLPYTQEALQHVVSRVQQVQDFLQRPLLLENVSSYVQFTEQAFSEAEFLAAVAKQSGCFILLDVNNVYVSATNHAYQADQFFAALPAEKVKQMHLAGFQEQNNLLVDTHGAPVTEAVWELYAKALQYFPSTPTNIEWDNNIPPLSTLLAEAEKAQRLLDKGGRA